MKRRQKNGYYLPISRKLFHEEKFQKLSKNAKWTYVVLCELEHQLTSGKDGSKENFFYRSDRLLAQDAELSIGSIWKVKKEFKKNDILEMWQMHWIDCKTAKKSEKHVTAYRLKE